MKKKLFNRTEEKIIKILYSYGAPLTIYEIAKETGMTFPTAKKYARILRDRGILKVVGVLRDYKEEYEKKKRNPNRYKFNFEILKK